MVAEHVGFARGLCRAVEVYREAYRVFRHHGAHLAHRRGAGRINELFAAGLRRSFEQEHRRARVVLEHGERSIAPAERDVNAGVAAFEPFADGAFIENGTFDERNPRNFMERWNLVRVPRQDADFVSAAEKFFSDIVTDESGSAGEKNAHGFTAR